MGLVRQKIFAHYFGSSDAGDAFYAALKIPNVLQNLLGDGVLSASFIPTYSRLMAEGRNKEADQVAGMVGTALALINAIFVLAGILAARTLILVIAPGFEGAKMELTVRLVRIFFPGTAILVMSAWCLGILNSHRRFFLSYVAPVFWNLAIITALVIFGGSNTQSDLAVYVAWGVFVGCVIQFSVQLPTVFRIARLRPGLSFSSQPLREVFRNLVPVVVARGAVQISAYIDNVLASLLPMGAVSSLAYAQALFLLPISLFGMSISAAELPAMSSLQGSEDEIAERLRVRMVSGLRQICFYIVPSTLVFWLLGDVIVGAIYQGGQFTRGNTVFVWIVLAGWTLGLLATTQARLYSSAFYSLKDTRTPLKYAIIRVCLTTALGFFFGLKFMPMIHVGASWGVVGLTTSAAASGWVEYLLLRRGLRRRIRGVMKVPGSYLAKLWCAGLLAGGISWLIKTRLSPSHPLVNLPLVLIPFGVVYIGVALQMRLPEVHALFRRLGFKRG